MLTDKAAKEFTYDIILRGEKYFRAGRVDIIEVQSEGLVRATVEGSETYQVDILVNPTKKVCNLSASCTCPYFEENGPCCKHIWAVILAIEASYKIAGPFRTVLVEELYDEELEDFAAERESESHLDNVLTALDSPQKKGLRIHSGKGARHHAPKPPPEWFQTLQRLASISGSSTFRRSPINGNALEPLYIIEKTHCLEQGQLCLSLARQTIKQDGTLGKIKKLSMTRADIPRIQNARDRDVCLMLLGATDDNRYYRYGYYGYDDRSYSSITISPEFYSTLLPMLFDAGRVFYRSDTNGDPIPLVMDDGPPWDFFIRFDASEDTKHFMMSARFQRNSEMISLDDIDLLIDGDPAIFIRQGRLHCFITHDCFEWIKALRGKEAVPVPASDFDQLIDKFGSMPRLPRIEWPVQWSVAQIRDLAPRPELNLHSQDKFNYWQAAHAAASVRFHYDGIAIEAGTPGGSVIQKAGGARQIWRQSDLERQLLNRTGQLGLEPNPQDPGRMRVAIKKIPALVSSLLKEGWTILGDKKLYRRPGKFAVEVTSGIDWFELNGRFDFDGQSAGLPELLAALKKGEQFIRLGDGSLGMLPEEWLAKHAGLLGLAHTEDGQVRFAKTQIGLLDALLAELPEATFDANIAAARQRLANFAGVQACAEPEGFIGELRPYQQTGLGWLRFLQDFEWGGCLADDMGLGKTIQVLALLIAGNESGQDGPTLVVVPKSLIFNWMREAARFAPQLRVLNYTGLNRQAIRDEFVHGNLILTTYGTLRRDIETLRKHHFHYVILDEAQAIKNPKSQNAKAARLLRTKRKLVMTGTPVENHLGDLWSLMDFLNPGMLGATDAFKAAFIKDRDVEAETDRLPLLQRILRPFILRRTKDQVAPELPSRSEQTIQCQMNDKQAAYYNELRDHYRTKLLVRVDKMGLRRSKIHVLEALLRLRQAACHPGLIDKTKKKIDSGKIESLMPMLEELIEEGHKALIFSQFTSMLAIVRELLDTRSVPYEYLDGQTRDRAKRVDRFQNDPDCPLFLISLKAGGVGLNLTAADYVFILDPWWNPAVEAQAIDRTHRIGQNKKVIAYRLISKDTVEEKILELQNSKRRLAESIITENNSLIQDLTVEDLSLLLS